MSQFLTRFKVGSIEDIDEADRKRFYLVPDPTWPGAPQQMQVVLSDLCPWCVGERVEMFVDVDEYRRHGHLPPTEIVRLGYSLEDCIKAENYEMAAIVRDEIKRRDND